MEVGEFILTEFPHLAQKTPSKIMLLVLDGVGGAVSRETPTALEVARTPNLDALAAESICGRSIPIFPGITPGSCPGHLALFGYDPVRFSIGRGVVEAMGIGLALSSDEVAIRGNFATIDGSGLITDRRAGRISTEQCAELCQYLQEKIPAIDDVSVTIRHGMEHRFVVVFRSVGLGAEVADTDPQKEGRPALPAVALREEAEPTARVANVFVERAKKLLADRHPANMVLLRGFSKRPAIPSMKELYRLSPATFAAYPLYRGVALMVGMDVIEEVTPGLSVREHFEIVTRYYRESYDYFFLHVKAMDKYGEDGNLEKKVVALEEVDRHLPILRSLEPEVFVVTGDHSTPWILKGHSWHGVPLLLHSNYCEPDDVTEFTERACSRGALGAFFPALQLMPLVMANALKLKKLGA